MADIAEILRPYEDQFRWDNCERLGAVLSPFLMPHTNPAIPVWILDQCLSDISVIGSEVAFASQK